MNTQHTPGEWFINGPNEGFSDYFIRATIENETFDICNLNCDKTGKSDSNARLIAAAPELLENLARIIDRIEESGLQDNFPSAYQRAKSAIRKATNQ